MLYSLSKFLALDIVWTHIVQIFFVNLYNLHGFQHKIDSII